MSPFQILSGAFVADKNILAFNNVFSSKQQWSCIRSLSMMSLETAIVHMAVILGWFHPGRTLLFLPNIQHNNSNFIANLNFKTSPACNYTCKQVSGPDFSFVNKGLSHAISGNICPVLGIAERGIGSSLFIIPTLNRSSSRN